MVATSKMFCPKCGKETEEEGLCKACFEERYVVFEVPQVVEVRVCAKCPSYKIGDLWVDTNIFTYEELAKKATSRTVRLALSVSKEVSNPQVTVVPEFVGPQVLKVRVAVAGEIAGRQVSTEADVEARVRKETCDVCSRIAGGYYEGIIQVRAQDRFPTKEEVNRCLKIVESTFSRAAKAGDRLAFITDVFPLPEGADVYIGSSTCARQASRAIVDEFGGTVTEAPKLVGAKEGKDLYRITFAVRLPAIVAGDIVRMRKQVVLVEKLGKRVQGVDLATGQPTSAMEDVKLEKISDRSQAVRTVLVSGDASSVQILDPETYQAITIRRPAFLKREPGEEVWAVKTPEGVFLLPGGSRGKE
ncbi:MAG: NMD3 family protein [Methanocella sp. PtaU1.Bin125]|nr:MAG: NMD3 family protein [Methanocella sp. PtaU1.Bin125]